MCSTCGCKNSESDGYTYAYSKGHKDGMGESIIYRPSMSSDREKNIYRKILKQKAESFEAQPNFNEETQEYEGTIKEIYKDPKTNEIRVKGRWYFPQMGNWVEYDEKGCQYEGCTQMYSPEWYDEDYCTTACANDMTICGKNKPYTRTFMGKPSYTNTWQDGAYGDFCQSLTEDVVYDRDGEEQEKTIMCNDCDYERVGFFGAETEDEEEWCVDCKTYVSAYDVVNAKGGDVCLPCWSKKGGEIIDGVAYTQEEASRYGEPKNYHRAETEYNRDTKGRFAEKPMLHSSIIAGVSLAVLYIFGVRK